MSANLTKLLANFSPSSSQYVQSLEKFSQHTLQDVSSCNVEKTILIAPFNAFSPDGDVTLISNEQMECHAVEKIHNHVSDSDYLSDCETLPKTKLRARYGAEANAHRNMKERAKSRGAVIHPSFDSFKDFLKCVGPVPAKGATLDRINNEDPEYAPGKVRWADKRTQNNNKGDTLVFYSAHPAETYTSSRLAKLQGVSAATIRQRLARGWLDDEIIMGKRKPHVGNKVPLGGLTPSVTTPKGIYEVKSCVKLELTPREKKYQQMAEEFRRCREEYGEEALPVTLDVLNEYVPVGTQPVTEEQYERRFVREFWSDMRPHVDFFNALPFHQKLIEKIDPEYVAMVRKKKKTTQEMKENNL